MNQIVTAEWLFNHLHDPNLIVLDASIEARMDGSHADVSIDAIPNARFFDLKKSFSDTTSPFPNTVPSPEPFEKECRTLGINKESQLVIFDNFGVYTSPRAWWLFKVMGHEKVAVLDGGLPQWMKERYPTVKKSNETYTEGNFKAKYKSNLVVNYPEIQENCAHPTFTIVDARSAGRFDGSEADPRKHLKSGHIPNSVNIPYQDVLHNGKFKNPDELEKLFSMKLNQDEKMVFSCGSGLTACIVMLACDMAFQEGKKVYDGSWTEWAEKNDLLHV